MTDHSSFLDCEVWFKMIKEHCVGNHIIVLLGNKSDEVLDE